MNASHDPHSRPWISSIWLEVGVLASHHCCSSVPPGQVTTSSAQPSDSSREAHPPATKNVILMTAQLRNATKSAPSRGLRQLGCQDKRHRARGSKLLKQSGR